MKRISYYINEKYINIKYDIVYIGENLVLYMLIYHNMNYRTMYFHLIFPKKQEMMEIKILLNYGKYNGNFT